MSSDICPSSGKLRFASAREARAYLKQWRTRTSKHAALPRHTYRCLACHAWHLTRVPPEQVQRRRRAS